MPTRTRERKSGGGYQYVERNRRGKIVGTTNIGRSINQDKRRKAKNHPTTVGHGQEGDYVR